MTFEKDERNGSLAPRKGVYGPPTTFLHNSGEGDFTEKGIDLGGGVTHGHIPAPLESAMLIWYLALVGNSPHKRETLCWPANGDVVHRFAG